MVKRKILVFISLVLLEIGSLSAQIKISGTWRSSAYGWESAAETKRWDFYQGLQFTIHPERYSNLSFSSYMRFARRGEPVFWDDRLYNLVMRWKDHSNRLQFRVGRQFVYSGVMNGTVDGVLLEACPARNVRVKILGGVAVPHEHNFALQRWSEGSVLGGYLSLRLSGRNKIDVSYIRRARDGSPVWHLLGSALNGRIRGLYYNAQIDYNLQTSSFQGMRYRLTYYLRAWSFSAEWNRQKPRIYEDSYFKIFKVRAFNQFRSGLTYQFKKVQVGIQYLFTRYEEKRNHQFLFTFGTRWGMVGLIDQNGFGGDNLGVYGEVRYPILSNFTFRLYSSYYNYQRHTIELSEEATSFSAGFQYQLWRAVRLEAELQQSINSYYRNDYRALVRLQYNFKN